MGFLVLIAGCAFVWLMQRSYGKASETREWPQVEAVVLESRVEVDQRVREHAGQLNTAAFILYGYEQEGERLTSERVKRRGQFWSNKPERAQALVEKYPVGARVPCFVNPQDARYAVLEHDSKAAGYSIWFPLIFVIGGGGMMVGVFFKK